MMLDKHYIHSGIANVNVVSKGQNTYAYNKNAELVSYCELAFWALYNYIKRRNHMFLSLRAYHIAKNVCRNLILLLAV